MHKRHARMEVNMIDTLKHVSIRGISCAVPDTVVKTATYAAQMGQDAVDKFISSVGIEQRHVARPEENITTADLCYVAAEKLIEQLQIDRNSIDGLIFVTQHPDYPTSPATACVLQHRLNLSMNCMAYDVNQGCTGYLYGLYIACAHLQSGSLKKILMLAGDAGHRVSPQDKSMAMLFGDAGSATLLEVDKNASPINVMLKTLGEGFRTIITPCGGSRHREGNHERVLQKNGIIRSDFDGYMDGTEVFNFTIQQVPKLMKEFCEVFGESIQEQDLFVLHQANLYMLNYLGKKMKLPKEKIPISIARYGNTSSASIPITLCDTFGGQKLDSKKIFMSAFGVGLSLGNISTSFRDCAVFPIIKTSESFDDGLL